MLLGNMRTHVTTHRATDIAEMVTAQPQWRLSYQQLSAGGYEGRIAYAALPRLHLTQESLSRAARQQGSLLADHVGLALAQSPIGACRFHGQLAGPDVVMVGLGHALDLITPDDCLLLATLLPRADFMTMLWHWHPRLAEQARSATMTLRLAPGQARHLRNVMQGLLRVLAEPIASAGADCSAALQQMQDALVLAWQDALQPPITPASMREDAANTASRSKLVQRACEHVHDRIQQHAEPPPTLLALCQAVGASPRKLAYCFGDVLGMSPARYLRLMRLNGAHRDLVHGADQALTVHEVATRWGFWHLGAFAQDYRRLFGRLPSETLGRRKDES